MFSRASMWTIFILLCLLIWIGTVMGSFAWKDNFIRAYVRTPAVQTPLSKKPFAFATPTDEEYALIASEKIPQNTIAIPVKKLIRIFSCPQKTCAVRGTVAAGEDLIVPTDSVPDANGWILVPWKTTQGFVNIDDIASGYQDPPPAPTTMLDPASAIPEKETPVDAAPIDPQTLVGIVCEFSSNDGYDNIRVTRGSGALITNDGFIITARSVVDLGYLNDGLDNFKLTQCLVGQLPASDPLPSTDAIRAINAFVRIPYLSYTAHITYIPKGNEASDYENAWLDFALLKINGVNADARYFGGPNRLPHSFPAAPFLISELPKMGDQTLNFAFPSGTTVGKNADIKTLFMQGLLSSVTGYWTGDKRYAENLFLIESHLDTEDTAGGRFGSPIFWKGYVIGVHTAKQQGSRQIYNVSAKAIVDDLFDNQFIIPLDVQ